MPTAKFCGECGEALKATRAGLAVMRSHCEKCAPGFRAGRFLKAATLALLVLIAFGIGRYVTPQRTVYMLGMPIEPIAPSEPNAASTNYASSTTLETAATGPVDERMTVCGAPTKSGKPCQRKVKGGGYCYQHRDKYGPKNTNRPAQ